MGDKEDSQMQLDASPVNSNWYLAVWWILTIALSMFIAPLSGICDATAWRLIMYLAVTPQQNLPEFICLTELWPTGVALGFLVAIGLSWYGASALWLKNIKARHDAGRNYAIALGIYAVIDIGTLCMMGVGFISLIRLPVLLGLYFTHRHAMKQGSNSCQQFEQAGVPPT